MKTKLLLFMALFSSAVSFSQINVAESFETGFPSSWQQFGVGFTVFSEAASSCNGTSFLTTNSSTENFYSYIQTPNYISSGLPITVSFQCKTSAGIVGVAYLYYELNNSGVRNLVASAGLGTSCINVGGTVPSTVGPSGTQIKFSMQINRSNGYNPIQLDNVNITQAAVPVSNPQTIAEYNFNESLNNALGNTPFTSSTTNTYGVDRNGNPNAALYMGDYSRSASISNLPIGNNARTISLWVRPMTINMGADYVVYLYGSQSANNAYGFSYTSSTINNFGWANDLTGSVTLVANVWKHIVCSYTTSGQATVYIDGVSAITASKPTWNTQSSNFNLLAFDGFIDDLKIYNYALSQTEINNLFNNNSLTNLLSVSNINSTSITTNSASINYSLNANNTTATSIVKYGLTSGNLTSSATGFTATGNTITPGTVSITGLLPNTQYFYTVEATNSNGTETSTESSFTTLANPMSTIAEYNFDNTYNNILGSRPFTANTGTSFTQDRAGNANSALNLVSIGTTATIPNLPYNSDSRTISVWVKNYTYNWFVASACPFSYGTNSNTYELYMAQSGMTVNPYSPYSNQHSVDLTALSITNALNTWNHYAVSYNGTTSKIYKDGVLLSTLNIAITPTTNNLDIFKLGLLNSFTSQYFDGAIDDLKIYNYALSDAEVTNLFNNNTLTSQNFNQNNLEVTLYPNPANDVLNVEMTNEVQLVEIYNIQGQKVVTSNQKQINVSDLSSGMYMVKVQDSENAIATKKVIIK